MRHLATKTLVVVLLAVFGSLDSKAQFVVTDPGNFVGNIANTTSQIAQALEEFGVVTEQLKEVKKIYDTVDGVMRVYTGVQEAWTAVTDLQNITQTTVRNLQNDRYLTTAEKIAVIRGCGKLIKLATNDIRQMSFAQKSNSGTGFGSAAERLSYLESIKDKILEYRNLAGYYTSQYSMASIARQSRYAGQIKMQLLTGGR